MSAIDDGFGPFGPEELDSEDDAAELFFEDLMGEANDLRRESGPPRTPRTINLPVGFRWGVWIDVGGRHLRAHAARHAALLQDLRFTEACIMINQQGRGTFGLNAVSETALRSFAPLLVAQGTSITLTSWLRPERRFIDGLVSVLPALARHIGARAIELDVEGDWRSRPVRDFANHTEAAEYLFRTLRPASTGLEIAVTCEVDPMPSTRMRPIVNGVDIVVPQAYSSRGSGSAHNIGGPYGPRGIQNRAVRKLSDAVRGSGKPMIMGLAAWDRHVWSGSSSNLIMRMELQRTIDLQSSAPIQGARYWSWAHIAGNDGRGGSSAKSYGIPFFRRSVNVPAVPPPAPGTPATGTSRPTTGTSTPTGTSSTPTRTSTPTRAPTQPAAPPPVPTTTTATPPPASESDLAADPMAEEETAERQLRAPLFRGDRVLHDVLNGRRLLRNGSRGAPVRKIQQALITLGHPLPRFGADGTFGSETRRSVRTFQRVQQIDVDGIVGPVTMGRLDDGMAARGVTPPPGRQRVLQTVRVELPLTRQRVEAAKLYNPERDQTSLRAVDARGASVDLSDKIRAETRASLQRYRQIHPALARAMRRLRGDDARLPILVWLFHEHELARKENYEQPRVARETTEPPRQGNVPADPYTDSLRASVRSVLERGRSRLREMGVRVGRDLGTVPVLVAQATRAQIDALSRLPDVTGLYLHETRGVPDLSTAITDARAAGAHSAGFKGANVRVAVWETTPASTANLDVEETFDSSAAASQSAGDRNHAQLVTAVIKNTQSTGSKGFAPDAKIFSANKYTNDALAWAVTTKQCTVVNQSFHYDSEETDPGLSAVDLIADYLVVHPPFPMIVQAAGNGPATEFVNHKGFNTTRVGNHVDGAGSMSGSSVFKNPTSTHNDRELPDLSANGTSVSAVGLTMSGTSFASPAVAGTAAVVQSVDATLRAWPEGGRAILLASAGRNIAGGTWVQAATSSTTDGVDGSGALDTREAARIARVRARRNSAAVRRGWDVGTLRSGDLRANGTSEFRYQIQVPASGARRLKAALAWSSKVTYTTDSAVSPPVKVSESKLTVDLDLYVFLNGALVAHSSTFDSSFEIVDFDAEAGRTYEIRIKRFSGTDWAWYGIAWTVL